MTIYDYQTIGGKNVIINYVDSLPKSKQLEIYEIREAIEEYGFVENICW